MVIYTIKVTSISGERTIKVPEKEINNLIETAKRLNWRLEFIA